MCLLYRFELRISKTLVLSEYDLNFERRTIRSHRGDVHKPRPVRIDSTALAMVEQWISSKRKHELKASTPLFCILKGMVVSSQSNICDMLKRRAKVRIGKRVHPHGFRHAYAMELIADESIPLNALQK